MNISVVIPLYNKERYIRDAIESVLAQTYSCSEIVVVDDGSTDHGVDVVKRIDDPRIRVYEQKNSGVSAARNFGVSLSKGDWIALLDGDDYWHNEFLEHIKRGVGENRSIQWGFTNYVYGNSRRPMLRSTPMPDICKSYFRFCLENDGQGAWSSCVFFRTGFLESVGGFPVGRAMGEDLDTWARMAAISRPLYIPKVLSFYRPTLGACHIHKRNSDVLTSLSMVRQSLCASELKWFYRYATVNLLRDCIDATGKGDSIAASEKVKKAELAETLPRIFVYAFSMYFKYVPSVFLILIEILCKLLCFAARVRLFSK